MQLTTYVLKGVYKNYQESYNFSEVQTRQLQLKDIGPALNKYQTLVSHTLQNQCLNSHACSHRSVRHTPTQRLVTHKLQCAKVPIKRTHHSGQPEATPCDMLEMSGSRATETQVCAAEHQGEWGRRETFFKNYPRKFLRPP